MVLVQAAECLVLLHKHLLFTQGLTSQYTPSRLNISQRFFIYATYGAQCRYISFCPEICPWFQQLLQTEDVLNSACTQENLQSTALIFFLLRSTCPAGAMPLEVLLQQSPTLHPQQQPTFYHLNSCVSSFLPHQQPVLRSPFLYHQMHSPTSSM